VSTRHLAGVAAAGIALLGAVPAQAAAPDKATVRIYDNYFLKDRLTVEQGARITWRWPGPHSSGDVHDVKLKSGPKGVKRFHSEAASTDYRYRRRLRKAGRYRIVCTLHQEMRMTIRVKRRR
jgi:plastocyanin